jgi:hypothetical protein
MDFPKNLLREMVPKHIKILWKERKLVFIKSRQLTGSRKSRPLANGRRQEVTLAVIYVNYYSYLVTSRKTK